MLAALVWHTPSFGLVGSFVIAAGLVGAIFAYTAGLRATEHAPRARFGLLALRLGAITALILALFHPACVSVETIAQAPLVAIILDDSASMQFPAGDDTDPPPPANEPSESRYTRARRILASDLRPALTDRHRIALFDVQARNLDDTLPDEPTAPVSPLTDTLLRIQRQHAREPLAALVLLSDGAENAAAARATLDALDTPTYAVTLTATETDLTATPDLTITAVAANQRALVGNTVRATVDLAITGPLPESPVPVTITQAGQPIAATSVTWPPNQRHARTTLEFTARVPGEYHYTVQAGPLPGETQLTDNRTTFPLAVRNEALTVLFIDGVLRWEGKFIRESLTRDPDINLVATTRTVPPGTDAGSQGLLTSAQLADVDVVLLGDIEATFFSASELTALADWVTDSGGALVLTGGYHSFGPAGFGGTALADVLPIEFSTETNPQIEQPFNLLLTDAGRASPIFSLTGDRARDAAFYHALPPLDGCARIAGTKPAATVLAVNPRFAGPDGSPGLPVIITQRVGSGRTLVMTIDTTYRWRLVVGGFTGDSSFYERFWGQLVRALVGYDDAQIKPLEITTTARTCELGDTIDVTITFTPPPTDEAAHRVNALATDERGQQINLPVRDVGDGRYQTTLTANTPGRLDLEALAMPLAQAPGAGMYSATTTVTVAYPDLETRQAAPNPQWLAQVAQLTGGRVLAPGEIARWAADLPATPTETTRVRSSGWRADYLLGGVCLLLLCTEWILRRWSRLV